MRKKIAQALARNVVQDSASKSNPAGGCGQAELAALGAPRCVVHFLQRTLERRAQIEVGERFDGTFEWFDMSGDGVQAALENLRHAVTAVARFPADEWPRAVHQAVETTLQFLINPVPALMDFCFPGGAAAVSVGDLQRRASYFREYAYVVQAVQAYTQKKRDKRVSRNELEATLNHVIRQYTSDFSVDDWMRTLEPLLEFVHVSGHVEGGLPVVFVVDFLRAHDRPEVAHVVEVEARMAKADMISSETLRRLIQEAEESPARGAGAPAEAAAPEEAAASAPADDDTRQPLWKQYAERQRRDAPDNTGTTPSAPLWKTFEARLPSRDAAPDASPASVSDVLGRAGRQADYYVASLFNGDRSAFDDVIGRLRTAHSWSEASAILARDVFKKYNIDIYSDDAVSFTNAVESRYANH